MSKSRIGVVRGAVGASLVLWGAGLGQMPRAGAQESPKPPYPHITLATSYEVDPHWPQRPSGVEWGQTPGIAVDAKDNVWVYTRAVPPVQIYSPDGRYLAGWGEGTIGSAHHIKFDREGNVWLADMGKHVVWQFDPRGEQLKVLGTPGEPGEDATHLNRPTDMAISPSGDVYVSDGYGNARVVHFDRHGKFVKAWGKLGVEPGQFSIPHAIAMDSKGRLYVADRNNVRVQIFEPSGQLVAQWRDLIVPWGIWMRPNDEMWICGSSPMAWRPEDRALGCPPKDQVFMKFDVTGRLLQLWTVPKAIDGEQKPGECNWVHAIAEDSQGNLYVSEIMGQRAQKFVRQK